KPPVWVESTAVGITAVSTPQAERMGSATVREHFPTPDRSCMAAHRMFLYVIRHQRPFAKRIPGPRGPAPQIVVQPGGKVNGGPKTRDCAFTNRKKNARLGGVLAATLLRKGGLSHESPQLQNERAFRAGDRH